MTQPGSPENDKQRRPCYLSGVPRSPKAPETPLERFIRLARRIVSVPKREVDLARPPKRKRSEMSASLDSYSPETHSRTLIESGVHEVPAWGCRIPYTIYEIRLRKTPLQSDRREAKFGPQLPAVTDSCLECVPLGLSLG